MLHEGCMKHRESVITSDFGRNGDKLSSVGRFQRDDKHLRQKLANCPDVEVFLPSGIRGDGYCEDAMGYVKCTWLYSAPMGDVVVVVVLTLCLMLLLQTCRAERCLGGSWTWSSTTRRRARS